jgi:poly(A) polymerase
MALSRERIADELLKLLGLPEPSPTVEIMLDRGILSPVLPEIGRDAGERLRALIAVEADAGIEPDGLRRLAALLPQDEAVANDVAVRLRLSNKARKRLVCAAGEGAAPARVLAYRLGSDCAVDRLLLAGDGAAAAAIRAWDVPRLPVSGGALIAGGLPAGPVVARTLRAIEARWVAAGFPEGAELQRIVDDALTEARS